MQNRPKGNISNSGWRRRQSAASVPVHPPAELLAYRDEIVRALAQGTSWAGGRVPLSFRSSPYQVRVGESHFFAPSAVDCLRLPALLGESLEVTSVCPSSGQTICLIISEQGVTRRDPPGSVMSLASSSISPGRPFDDPRDEDRQLSRFFSSPEAAALWLVAFPGVEILDLDRAWRLINGVAFGDGKMMAEGLE